MRKPRLRAVKILPKVTQLTMEMRVEPQLITKPLQCCNFVFAQCFLASTDFLIYYLF